MHTKITERIWWRTPKTATRRKPAIGGTTSESRHILRDPTWVIGCKPTTTTTSKHKIFNFFFCHFCPPDSKSGYGSTVLLNPDREHWCQYTLLVPVFIFPLLGLLELVELRFLGLGQILPDLLVPTFITWHKEKQWFKTLNPELYRYGTLRCIVKVHRKAEAFPS